MHVVNYKKDKAKIMRSGVIRI